MNYTIRKAVMKEARKVVEVQTAVWLTTYKNLLPDEILEEKRNTIAKRTPAFALQIQQSNNIFVAVVNEKIIGVMSCGQCRNDHDHADGELYCIYILEEFQGFSIGKQLLKTAMKQLIDKGYHNMYLNVLKGNKTIHFYEKYGGVIIKTRQDLMQNHTITEFVMYFSDLEALLYRNF